MGFFYLLLVAGVAYFAKLRGRSPLAWAVIALLISPLLSGILLLFLKNLSTDGYRGDTIDTTAKPVPEQEPADSKRTYQGTAKKYEDVDAAISRMEEKLSKDKNVDNVTTTAKATAVLGAASVLTSGENPPQETAEPNSSQAEVNSFNLSSQEVLSVEPASSQAYSNAEVFPQPPRATASNPNTLETPSIEESSNNEVAVSEAEVISTDFVEPGTLQQPSSQASSESRDLVQPGMDQVAGGAVVLENNSGPKTPAFCECCGQPLTPGANFCTNCGAPIAKQLFICKI